MKLYRYIIWFTGAFIFGIILSVWLMPWVGWAIKNPPQPATEAIEEEKEEEEEEKANPANLMVDQLMRGKNNIRGTVVDITDNLVVVRGVGDATLWSVVVSGPLITILGLSPERMDCRREPECRYDPEGPGWYRHFILPLP